VTTLTAVLLKAQIPGSGLD